MVLNVECAEKNEEAIIQALGDEFNCFFSTINPASPCHSKTLACVHGLTKATTRRRHHRGPCCPFRDDHQRRLEWIKSTARFRVK